ncbi:MAG: RNA methyltransferase [Hungatella sp.]
MITSTNNAQVKQVAALLKKSKYRKETGLFVVEGIRMFSELPKDRIHMVYISESFGKHSTQSTLLHGISQVETVSDEVFRSMSDTQNPQGILALVKQYAYTLEEVCRMTKPTHLMVLETIQDPGNLGTIMRAGEGAGITGIIMDSTTVDLYNPKVIRSTMGSIYRVPFVYVENLIETLEVLKQKSIRFYAAHLKAVHNYDQEDYTGNIGFLIGNEAAGLSDEVAKLADRYITIPMAGQVESLNAAVAASVLMFEAARQRRS